MKKFLVVIFLIFILLSVQSRSEDNSKYITKKKQSSYITKNKQSSYITKKKQTNYIKKKSKYITRKQSSKKNYQLLLLVPFGYVIM
tara:strand:+ start:535 stop:792 length:258 start_codon:yes stop_codon:yes gene_type:complete